MGQWKKEKVRSAILDSAMYLFSRKGYAETTLSEIAKRANISSANTYVYFESKLEILYAIYDPWIRARLLRLEADVSRLSNPEDKLRLLLNTLWSELPAEKTGLVNNIMQALSTALPRDRYQPTTLNWTIKKLERILNSCLPAPRRKLMSRAKMGYLLLMAYDGFAIYRRVHPTARPNKLMIDAVISMILGRQQILPSKKRRSRASQAAHL